MAETMLSLRDAAHKAGGPMPKLRVLITATRDRREEQRRRRVLRI